MFFHLNPFPQTYHPQILSQPAFLANLKPPRPSASVPEWRCFGRNAALLSDSDNISSVASSLVGQIVSVTQHVFVIVHRVVQIWLARPRPRTLSGWRTLSRGPHQSPRRRKRDAGSWTLFLPPKVSTLTNSCVASTTGRSGLWMSPREGGAYIKGSCQHRK